MKKLLLLSLISFWHVTQPISLETKKNIYRIGITGGLVGYAYSVIQWIPLISKLESIQQKLRIDRMTDTARAAEIKRLETCKKSWVATKSMIASWTATQELLKAKNLTPQEREDLLKKEKRLQYQIYKYSGSFTASYLVMLGSIRAFENVDREIFMQHWQARNGLAENVWQQAWQQNQPIRDAAIQQLRIARQENLTRRATQRAAQQGNQQECIICTGTTAAENYIALTCQHRHCPDCLEHLITNALQERSTAELRCPELNCRQAISANDIERITDNDQEVINTIARIRLREHMVTQPNFKQCPTPNCTHFFISDTNNIQTMTCPECNVEYCSNCLHEHPNTIPCQQRIDNAWIEQNTQPCPRCNARIERSAGCQHMHCINCRYEFCWRCLQASHVHFGCQRPAVNPHLQHPFDNGWR